MSMWNNIICLGCLSGWGWFLLPSRFLMSTLTSLQRFTMAQIRVRHKKSSTWCETNMYNRPSWGIHVSNVFRWKKSIKKIPFQNISKKRKKKHFQNISAAMSHSHPPQLPIFSDLVITTSCETDLVNDLVFWLGLMQMTTEKPFLPPGAVRARSCELEEWICKGNWTLYIILYILHPQKFQHGNWKMMVGRLLSSSES